MEELELETWARSAGYERRTAMPYPFWDLILKEWVEREPNATLFLNTYAMDVDVGDAGIIEAVRAIQTTTESHLVLRAPVFVDATGDGTVGFLAGADYRTGRESQAETGERRARESADGHTLPTSLRYAARDWGRPVDFIPPPWARVYRTDDDLAFRHHRRFDLGVYWISCGGTSDTISDAETIRDELYAIVLGVWDHIKNRDDHGAQNYALEWIGHVPCKRESRRFLGDHILSEQDLETGVLFDDRVAYGFYPIDIHPPEGIDAFEIPSRQTHLDAPYSIPLRSLYSRNVNNLFLAGRDISVTHVALGSTRVMKTCAVIGQAAGTAAHFAAHYGVAPRELVATRIREVQQELLKNDAFLVDMPNEDPTDLARRASITASSAAELPCSAGNRWRELGTPCSQIVPLTAGRIDEVALFLTAPEDVDREVHVRVSRVPTIHAAGHDEDELVSTRATVAAGSSGWLDVPLGVEAAPGLYRIVVGGDERLSLAYSLDEPVGTQAAYWSDTEAIGECELASREAAPTTWRAVAEHGADIRLIPGAEALVENTFGYTGKPQWVLVRGTYSVRCSPTSRPYEPSNVISGVDRPYTGTNLWMSDPALPLPQWIELDFREQVLIGMIQLTFDSNLDLPDPGSRELEAFDPAVGHVPELVRDYDILAIDDADGETWRVLLSVEGSHQRLCRHYIEATTARRLRVAVTNTWGAPTAQIYAVRVYSPLPAASQRKPGRRAM